MSDHPHSLQRGQLLSLLLGLDVFLDELLMWLTEAVEGAHTVLVQVIAVAGEGIRTIGKIIIWKDIIRWSLTWCQNILSWVERIRWLLGFFWAERILKFLFVWFFGLLVLWIFQILFWQLFLVYIKRSGFLGHFKDSVCLFNTLEISESSY